MAAITAVARTLRAGDEILADIDLYGGTCRLFTRILERSGIRATYADAGDPASFAAKITPRTRLLFVESPTNPLMRVNDLRALAALAHDQPCAAGGGQLADVSVPAEPALRSERTS